jgi:hypothetical protein
MVENTSDVTRTHLYVSILLTVDSPSCHHVLISAWSSSCYEGRREVHADLSFGRAVFDTDDVSTDYNSSCQWYVMADKCWSRCSPADLSSTIRAIPATFFWPGNKHTCIDALQATARTFSPMQNAIDLLCQSALRVSETNKVTLYVYIPMKMICQFSPLPKSSVRRASTLLKQRPTGNQLLLVWLRRSYVAAQTVSRGTGMTWVGIGEKR